jgi:CMP-N-acetylneuraminic acid synthetase
MKFQPVTFIRKNSTRLPNKSFLEIDSKPLCYYSIKTMSDLYLDGSIEKPIIYASENYFIDYDCFNNLEYKFHKRKKSLDGDVDFNMLMSSFLNDKNTLFEAEYIIFFCVTGPFMKKETIKDMVSQIKQKNNDSSFTGIEIRNFCWFNNKPLNYKLGKNIPWTQNLTPVIQEASSLYIFNKNNFLKTGRRIGYNPYIKIVDPIEGHDIDYQHEFTIAKKIIEG